MLKTLSLGLLMAAMVAHEANSQSSMISGTLSQGQGANWVGDLGGHMFYRGTKHIERLAKGCPGDWGTGVSCKAWVILGPHGEIIEVLKAKSP